MLKNENGKRERGNVEEDSEFMPLSKRINNIHLTQSQLNNGILHLNGHVPGSSAQLQNGESSHSNQNHNSSPQDHNGQQDPHTGHLNGHGHGHYNGKEENGAVQGYSTSFNSSANVSSLGVNATVNNLHQQQSHSFHNTSASSAGPSHCQPLLHNDNQGQNYIHQSLSSSFNSASVSISNISNTNFPEQDFRYEPVLNQSANPHYYEQNRQLFQLYMERLQRYNLPPHPHFYSSSNNELDTASANQHQHHHHNHNSQV